MLHFDVLMFDTSSEGCSSQLCSVVYIAALNRDFWCCCCVGDHNCFDGARIVVGLNGEMEALDLAGK